MTDSAHSKNKKRLVLFELNEVNFDVVSRYIEAKPESFPALRTLLAGARARTTAEKHYDELEPWIQWASVHTGLSYGEHGVYRLGDIVGSKSPQLFEQLEAQGLRLGCVSPMNAENRLQSPAYFIPDPWTKTAPDRAWWSKVLAEAVSQAVNDNAQERLSAKSIFHLILGLLRFAQPKHYRTYWRLASHSKGAPWRKALVLDLLLHDLHSTLFKSHRPDFSTLFLNAGAYIQHHYFFNAKPIKDLTEIRNPDWYVAAHEDPIVEMLQIYDLIIGEYLSTPNLDVVVATGLSQRPYDRIKFYYRIRDHQSFLQMLGVKFKAVQPRMTRDFLIEFESNEDAASAERQLADVRVAGAPERLFNEIDNRGSSLFVTLTYPREVHASTAFELNGATHLLAPHVVFVAIKNGMHQQEGFAFFTPGIAPFAPLDGAHVKELYTTILGYFGAPVGLRYANNAAR